MVIERDANFDTYLFLRTKSTASSSAILERGMFNIFTQNCADHFKVLNTCGMLLTGTGNTPSNVLCVLILLFDLFFMRGYNQPITFRIFVERCDNIPT